MKLFLSSIKLVIQNKNYQEKNLPEENKFNSFMKLFCYGIITLVDIEFHPHLLIFLSVYIYKLTTTLR